ncbi:plasmid partitioning protein RepB C-terminal domain-containing protein [Taklimakanibacter deserti]|uniref:plasmid partitioning protein RepB C-terminal domain-containing protein n=1 Tax=Taklimakanibacter deserti TaxID=2267839 RepID=UPI0034D6C943
MTTTPQVIQMIPIERITFLNPRVRNRRNHQVIVDNIEAVGIKRPITVSRRATGGEARYDLICGQGRVEAFRMLGETEIPAVVIDAPESECLVRSLVENIARRQHRPLDIMQEIGSLRERGYSDAEIAKKVGCTQSWVFMINVLLSRGEERLVSAVEAGIIPLSLAVDIAKAETDEAQNILIDAHAAGKLRGKKLTAIRKILDQRLKRSRTLRKDARGARASRRVTTQDLMRVYQREAEKQRLLVKKSDFAQAKLLFIIEAVKDLLSDDGFRKLLRAEELETMPQALALRVDGQAQ